MKWRTILPVRKAEVLLDHDDQILSLGSCFATNIGGRLRSLKWRIEVNPLGIVYNPVSLFRQISYLLEPDSLKADDLVERDGLFHHWDFHGDLSGRDPYGTAESLKAAIRKQSALVASTDWLFVTLGTAMVYTLRSSQEVVANCHKFPVSDFERHRLDRRVMFDLANEVIPLLLDRNPGLRILLSVSPVRHLSDGLIENNRSKAELIGLADDLTSLYSRIHYFPGYELLLDDLRDYRFYDRDLAHPNEIAMDYIWEYFSRSMLTDQAMAITAEIESIGKDLAHRPLNPGTDSHLKFLENLLGKMDKMSAEYDHIHLSEEIESVRAQLEALRQK